MSNKANHGIDLSLLLYLFSEFGSLWPLYMHMVVRNSDPCTCLLMCLFSPRVVCVGVLVFLMVTFDGMDRNHKGVIPKYTEVLDEMTTGTCVALEVSRESNASPQFRAIPPHDAHARRHVSRITITIESR